MPLPDPQSFLYPEANSLPTQRAHVCPPVAQEDPPPPTQPMTLLHTGPSGMKHRKHAQSDEGSGPRLPSEDWEEPRSGLSCA